MTAMPDFFISFYIFLSSLACGQSILSTLFSDAGVVTSFEFERFNREFKN